MDTVSNVYGAKAKAYIKFEDSINELANRISKSLNLPQLEVEHSEYPPYNLIGSCEALGFEIWLNPSNAINNWQYILEIATKDCHEEIFSDQMYDLSNWLARYVSDFCHVDTLVVNLEDKTGIVFSNGEQRRLENIIIVEEDEE